MRRLFALSSLLLFFISAMVACRKDNDEGERINYETLEYRPGWKIIFIPDTVQNQQFGGYLIEKGGNSIVFVYSHGYSEPKIADGGYGLSVLWEVPDTATYFRYAGLELAQKQSFVMSGGGYVPRLKTQLISEGSIEGHKTGGNTWEVTMDITLPEKDPTLGIQHIQHMATYSVKYY